MSSEEQKGAPGPPSEPPSGQSPSPSEPAPPSAHYEPTTDIAPPYDDPYAYPDSPQTALVPPPAPQAGNGSPPPPPPPKKPEEPPEKEPEEENGMLRMSFLEHLEELRTRILRALMGIGIAYALCLFFADELWTAVDQPVMDALRRIGIANPRIIQTSPMESFTILWVKLPIVAAIFVASPWVLFQVWSFIAPGLYKRERRWASPFIIVSAGLFVLGGVFAYFVAFRYGLAFLLGIGVGKGIDPLITVSEYFDMFINVMLGVGLVFEMPVFIFFLALLRIVTPKFLLSNSRYAILIIVIIAAIITPTPDVFNLMLFATPMCILFYVGIFAAYLLQLSREGRRFPWWPVLRVAAIVAAAIGGVLYLAVAKYGYHLVLRWPFLTR